MIPQNMFHFLEFTENQVKLQPFNEYVKTVKSRLKYVLYPVSVHKLKYD